MTGGGAHAAREIQRRGSRNIASAERKFIILFVVRTGYRKQKGCIKGVEGWQKKERTALKMSRDYELSLVEWRWQI